MITDFFIATTKEVLEIENYSDLNRFPVLQAKNVESIKLMTLEKIFTNEEVEILNSIKELDSNNAWLIPISKNLVEEFSILELNEINKIASIWAKTDEWVLDNGTVSDLTSFLESFYKIARQSVIENKELFVLIAL